MKFPEKLQMLRKGKDLSQEEFAEIMNVSRQSVSKWESGQSYPEIEKLIEISNYCNVSLDYLLKDANGGAVSEKKNNSAHDNDMQLTRFKLRILTVLSAVCMWICLSALSILYRLPNLYLVIYIGILSLTGISLSIYLLFKIRKKVIAMRNSAHDNDKQLIRLKLRIWTVLSAVCMLVCLCALSILYWLPNLYLEIYIGILSLIGISCSISMLFQIRKVLKQIN